MAGKAEERLPDPVRAVAQRAAEAFRVEFASIIGRRRTSSIARFRKLVMHATREATHASYPELGKAFDRDHTVIMQACVWTVAEMKRDEMLARDMEKLIKELRAEQRPKLEKKR